MQHRTNYSPHTIVPGSGKTAAPQVSQQDWRNKPAWAQFPLAKSRVKTQVTVGWDNITNIFSLLIKYLLIICYEPGNVLGTEDTMAEQADACLPSWNLVYLLGLGVGGRRVVQEWMSKYFSCLTSIKCMHFQVMTRCVSEDPRAQARYCSAETEWRWSLEITWKSWAWFRDEPMWNAWVTWHALFWPSSLFRELQCPASSPLLREVRAQASLRNTWQCPGLYAHSLPPSTPCPAWKRGCSRAWLGEAPIT